MNLEIQIDDELVARIMVNTLKKDCISLASSVREYRRVKELSNLDLEDLRDNERTLLAIKEVLKYYTVRREYEEFVQELGV
jgi:hypothetical protein